MLLCAPLLGTFSVWYSYTPNALIIYFITYISDYLGGVVLVYIYNCGCVVNTVEGRIGVSRKFLFGGSSWDL